LPFHVEKIFVIAAAEKVTVDHFLYCLIRSLLFADFVRRYPIDKDFIILMTPDGWHE
jgi:hypothetical protein